MKKIGLLFAVMIMSMLFAVSASAESYDDFEYEITDGTVTITGYTGEGGNVAIPAEIDGYAVICIDDYAFYNCDDLEKIEIGESVTSIGEGAFNGCCNIQNFSVSENNEFFSVDEYGVLFNKDKTVLIKYPVAVSRTEYIIADTVTSIEWGAFEYAEKIETVIIPDSVTYIGISAFSNCYSLANITIPDNVTKIDDFAFSYCESLTEITIPDSVTNISWGAFSYCENLEVITLPNNAINIGDIAFYNTSYYKNDSNWIDDVLYIGNHLIKAKDDEHCYIKPGTLTIAACAFYDCMSLKNIIIPESVISIGYHAFDDCTNLESITLPDSITNISSGLFIYCINLKSITISDSIKNIDEHAFSYCESLNDVYYSGNISQWNEVTIKEYNESLATATIHCTDGDIIPEKKPTDDETTDDNITTTEPEKTTSEIEEPTESTTLKTEPTTTKPTTTKKEETTTKTPSTTATTTTLAPTTVTTTTEKEKPVVKTKKPAKVKIKKPKSTNKKQSAITWTALKNVNGYQLSYSTSKKFTKKTTKTKLIKKAKTTKTTLKKLKSGKKYFIRIRAYKTVNSKKIYGAWSAVKTVKIK